MLSQLDDQKRGEVTRLMGMKMEQVCSDIYIHIYMYVRMHVFTWGK
jgi:hypothetical protein